MIIGVPKEIKSQEHRVGLIPSTATTLTRKGHTVLVQKNAGVGAGYTDENYTATGAQMVDRAEDVFALAASHLLMLPAGGEVQVEPSVQPTLEVQTLPLAQKPTTLPAGFL